MKIVMLMGNEGCGKDTYAEMMEDIGYVSYSFGDRLKVCTANFLNVSLDIFYDRREKDTPKYFASIQKVMTPREAIIEYSEKVIKPYYGKNIWATHVESLIKNELYNGLYDKFVIPDLRFYEEYEIFKNYDPIIIRIDAVRNGEVEHPDTDTYPIFSDFDVIDSIFDNNFDIQPEEQFERFKAELV